MLTGAYYYLYNKFSKLFNLLTVRTNSNPPMSNLLSIYYEAYNKNSAMSEELSLPSYLRILPQRVILCTQHGSCYTKGTLERHLVRKHKLKGDPKKLMLEKLEQVHIAADVQQPIDRALRIPQISLSYAAVPVSFDQSDWYQAAL